MQNWSKSPKKERHLAAFKTEAAPKSKCLFVICDAERDSQRLHIRQEYRFRIKQYNKKKKKKLNKNKCPSFSSPSGHILFFSFKSITPDKKKPKTF